MKAPTSLYLVRSRLLPSVGLIPTRTTKFPLDIIKIIAYNYSTMTFNIKKLKIKKTGRSTPKVTYKGKAAKYVACHSRFVFRCGKAAVKIGVPHQAVDEINFYKHIKKKDTKYFPKLKS